MKEVMNTEAEKEFLDWCKIHRPDVNPTSPMTIFLAGRKSMEKEIEELKKFNQHYYDTGMRYYHQKMENRKGNKELREALDWATKQITTHDWLPQIIAIGKEIRARFNLDSEGI